LIKQIRQKKKDVLLFDTGDMFSAYVEEIKSKYTLKSYEYLKYDAVCIGDQEFVEGTDFFKEIIKKLPVVIANFSLCENDICHLVGRPFKMFEINGIKVGVTGVISKNAFKYYPKTTTKQIKVDDSLKTIRHYLKKLKK